jgi:hypothetical protein
VGDRQLLPSHGHMSETLGMWEARLNRSITHKDSDIEAEKAAW